MKKVFLKYNQIGHLNTDYVSRVRGIGDFYQQLPYDTDFEVIDADDLDRAFNMLPKDTDWVVVVAYGHCTQDRGMYNDLIDKCIELNAPLMGHILNFDNQYPHLHPQLFVVNYQTWLTLGLPKWNYSAQPDVFKSVSYTASKETFHDEYTPLWIAPADQEETYSVTEMQVGAQVIRCYLEAGITVHNIPELQRSRKFHLYPDQDTEALADFLFLNKKYTGNNHAQANYASLIGHLEDQVQSQYYVLNTEPLTKVTVDTPITHYAGVAAGIKLFCTMVKNGFDRDTAVTIFDFSDIALKYQQYLIDTWNGDLDLYQSVWQTFELSNPGHFPCLPSGAWSDTFNHVLSELGLNKQEFQAKWQEYQQLNHQFETINLYDSSDWLKLARLCKPHTCSYVWVSNAFYMEYSVVTLGMHSLERYRIGFGQTLINSGAKIILDANDCFTEGLEFYNK
jgi:hypothetical protein